MILVGFSGVAFSADPEKYFTVDATGNLTGYSGPGGVVVIPEVVNGITVTEINTENVIPNGTDIFVPKTVTSIGNYTLYPAETVRLENKNTTISYLAFHKTIYETVLNKIIGYTGSTAQTYSPSKFVSFESMFTYSNGIITGYTGSEEVVIVPSTLGNVTVTAIGDNAFSGKNISRVVLPASVTTIGANAFKSSTLAVLNMPDDMPSVKNIGTGAFSYSNLESIRLNNSVTTIGKSAFAGATNLTYVKLPKNLTTIGEEAFSGCVSLASIDIPENVTLIDKKAFYNCPSLSEITLGTKVNKIANNAFNNCTNLNDIKIYNYDMIIENNTAIPQHTRIHGYSGSSAELFANKNNREFIPFTDADNWNDYFNYVEYTFDPTKLNYKGSFYAGGTRSYEITCLNPEIIIKAYPNRIVIPEIELIFSTSDNVTLVKYEFGQRSASLGTVQANLDGNRITLPERVYFPLLDEDSDINGVQLALGYNMKVDYSGISESYGVPRLFRNITLPPYNNQIGIVTLGQTSVTLNVDFHGMRTKEGASGSRPMAKLQRSSNLIDWFDICDFLYVDGPYLFTDHGLIPDTTYYYRALYCHSVIELLGGIPHGEVVGTFQGGRYYLAVNTSEDMAAIYAQQAQSASESAAVYAEEAGQMATIAATKASDAADKSNETLELVRQLQQNINTYESSITPTILSLQASNNATATKSSTIQINVNAVNAGWYRIGKGSTFKAWQTSPVLTSPTLSAGANTLIVEAKRKDTGDVTQSTITVFKL